MPSFVSTLLQVAVFMSRAIELAGEYQSKSGKTVTEFTEYLVNEQPTGLVELKKDVEDFCLGFEMIGC